jgi:hypothetical protein
MLPAIHHALKEAHGAQEVLPQLKSSVQVDPTPKPTPHQPAVPSSTASAKATVPGSTTVQDAQSLRPPPGAASMPSFSPRTDRQPTIQLAGSGNSPARSEDHIRSGPEDSCEPARIAQTDGALTATCDLPACYT